jgi:hypothetical protein
LNKLSIIAVLTLAIISSAVTAEQLKFDAQPPLLPRANILDIIGEKQRGEATDVTPLCSKDNPFAACTVFALPKSDVLPKPINCAVAGNRSGTPRARNTRQARPCDA